MNYLLAEACQNTFLLFDWMQGPEPTSSLLQKVHQCLVEENKDDALLLTSRRKHRNNLYVQMSVLGQDGNLGEFCGNGARACAAYLYHLYPDAQEIYLCSSQGEHPLNRCAHNMFTITLPKVTQQPNPKFLTHPNQLPEGFHYAEILEPHLVVFYQMSDDELMSIGQALNLRKDLFPHGINLNCCHLLENSWLSVKTYERGVQRLTRSCGTGSICCAALSKKSGQVFVQTPGGLLEIDLQPDQVILKGPAFFGSKA